MKHRLRWTLIVLVLLALGAGLLRTLLSRQEKARVLQAQQSAQQAAPSISLAAADVLPVNTVLLSRTLEISGALKAVHSAFVKARVPGELLELTVREGEQVKAGQVLARIERTEFEFRLRQAQQQAQAAQAQVDIARRGFENNRSLVEQGFISKTALDTSMATLAAAQASYLGAQAGVELAQKSLDDTLLRAPMAGFVAQRLVQPGERVAVDTRMLEIVDVRELELEASVSASDAAEVKIGQQAQLSVEGMPEAVSAQVVRINPSAVSSNRAVLLYLAVRAAPSAGLRQGLFAQGKLALGSTRTLAVPLSAVYTDKPQPYVQVLRDGQVQHQSVTLGARGTWEGQAMVGVHSGSGLAEGERVLSARVGILQAGTHATLAGGAL